MIRVILTDDHLLVRKGLRQLLEEHPNLQVVGEAGSVAELIALLQHTCCDVLVLDISLPGRSGLDALRQVRINHPSLPVLILSMHSEEQYAARSLRLGAAGYLTKESAPDRLVEAIRTVYAGGRVFTPQLIERVAIVDTGRSTALPHTLLSDREFEILRLIASGHTLTGIADRLCLSIKTISTYRTRLLDKMQMKNNVELTAYVRHHQLDD